MFKFNIQMSQMYASTRQCLNILLDVNVLGVYSIDSVIGCKFHKRHVLTLGLWVSFDVQSQDVFQCLDHPL